jgi:hypothetical protein
MDKSTGLASRDWHGGFNAFLFQAEKMLVDAKT